MHNLQLFILVSGVNENGTGVLRS